MSGNITFYVINVCKYIKKQKFAKTCSKPKNILEIKVTSIYSTDIELIFAHCVLAVYE